MASSLTESTAKQRHVQIQPKEIWVHTLANTRARQLEAGQEKNKWDYPILVFFNNDELTFDGKQKAVCYYFGEWCTLGYNKEANASLAGKWLPKINQYDILPSTCHHSDDKEQPKGEDKPQDSPESDFRPDPTSFLIWHSWAVTPISSQPSLPFWRVPTPIRPVFHTQAFSTKKWSPITMSQTAAITTCYNLFWSIVLSLLIQTYPRCVFNYLQIICTTSPFTSRVYSHARMCKCLSDLSVNYLTSQRVFSHSTFLFRTHIPTLT